MSRQKCEEEFETLSGFWQIADYWVARLGFPWHCLLQDAVGGLGFFFLSVKERKRLPLHRSGFMAAFM